MSENFISRTDPTFFVATATTVTIASHRDVKMFVQSQVQMLERRLIEILLACFIDENVSLSFRMYVIGFRFISIQNCTLERDTD